MSRAELLWTLLRVSDAFDYVARRGEDGDEPHPVETAINIRRGGKRYRLALSGGITVTRLPDKEVANAGTE